MGTAISKWTMVLALAGVPVLLAATAQSTRAQTFDTLQSLCSETNCKDGAYPSALIQAKDGKFYGTTVEGGVYSGNCPPLGCGTVFKVTPGGKLSTLHSFDDADGENPVAGLIQDASGELYGTTYGGGIYTENCDQLGCGTVFKITTAGKLVTLYSFCSQLASNGDCADGNYPSAGLILAANGNIYGTTRAGGAADSGTVFTIAPSGELTTLYSFCSQTGSGGSCTDGSLPFAGLVQGTDGNLYGVTQRGGTNNAGTVFTITYGGELTTLYAFCSLEDCADGEIPSAGLIQATDHNFYATTAAGGAHGAGTAFKITSGGALTTLYSFCAEVNADKYCADGGEPTAGLIQGSDQNFYGTTVAGGADNEGTIFSLTPVGTLTTLHSFCSQVNSGGYCTDGNSPSTGLILGPNGFYYGTTQRGGAAGYGTVFKLKP